MARLVSVDPSKAEGKSRELLGAVKAKLGIVPNMTKVMAGSPSVLEGYLAFSGALAGGTLSPVLREQIALVVGAANECEYCVRAHTAIGRKLGLSPAELEANLNAGSSDAKVGAALGFAKAVSDQRGGVSDEEFALVREAGYTDAEISEIIANVALNVLTNYYNRAAAIESDFPAVRHGREGAVTG